jgi:hypothetical protein
MVLGFTSNSIRQNNIANSPWLAEPKTTLGCARMENIGVRDNKELIMKMCSPKHAKDL